MELIVEEIGQALLAILGGGATIAVILWVLECASAF